MPYRHAHYFIGFVLAVIIAGFWASYFAVSESIPVAFHVHAVSAMAWLALLLGQHLVIQRRANALHRQMGKASFALFPFLIVGFVMIINVSAKSYAARESDFIMYNGPSFGIGMIVAIGAYITLFYLALKNRRNVKLHAGYMLATPLILFESPFSRVIGGNFPWMNVIGSEGFHGLIDTIIISNAMAMTLAFVLYLMDRRNGAPWLVAIGFIAAQSLAMWFAPSSDMLGSLFDAYATIPREMTLVAGLFAGAAAGWLGWEAGKRPKRAAVMPA
ncbi:hypothetical protein [Erythrobacter alti]|uniref:hypothetical protein n=1 Tax=Erythrobacter alti TaxID=1896145 RepID=UPI0030F38B50